MTGPAKVRERHPGMNQLESDYAAHLEQRRLAGEIREWAYEPERLILGRSCSLLPDFRVVTSDGYIEVHETKGQLRDDAWAKLKIAADLHPYRFFLVRRRRKKDGGGWDIQEVPPRGGAASNRSH